MPSRLPLSRLLALLPLGFVLGGAGSLAIVAAPVVRAEDAPTEEKPKKKETDDASIFMDQKLCMNRGAKHCQTRGEYWEGKGATGKDLMWLGKIWKRAENYPKAIAALEGFLEYKPPAGDTKLIENYATNRETALKFLAEAALDGKEYAKVITASQKLREEYSASKAVPEMWDIEGRAQRLAGDEEKAIEAFTKSAELKHYQGLFDLLDLHMANGNIEAAKASFDKMPKDDSGPGGGNRDKFVDQMKAFVDSIGTPVEGLDKAVNVGRGEAPTFTGKPTLFYYWHLQVNYPDRKLNAMDAIRRGLNGTANVVGVSKYNHYNPEISKIEPDMTAEKEIEWYKKAIENWGIGLSCIVVPDDVANALSLKLEGQFVITDAEGKLRYIRINQEKPYDRQAVAIALEKITGKAPPK